MSLLKALGDAIFGNSLGEFKVRITETEIEGINTKILQAKGIIPVRYSDDFKTLVTLRDVTENEAGEPILCLFEQLQSPNRTYLQETDIGYVGLNAGWTDWVNIGMIPTQFLVPPRTGERKIQIILAITDILKEKYHWVSLVDDSNINNKLHFYLNHIGKGWADIDDDVDETNDLTIKIAVAIAMSEGSLDDKEGETIKIWIEDTIAIYSEETKKELKNKFNKSFKSSYAEAKNGKLELGKLIREFEKIADENAKYKCLDLCYAVMAADGEAAPEELEMIDQISKSLKLDSSELSKIRDSNLANINMKKISGNTLEELLNIDTSQPNSEIKKFLNKEFQKWNSRINTVSDKKEKEKAQEMINLISEARKKYR